jgi:hypothetical protein
MSIIAVGRMADWLGEFSGDEPVTIQVKLRSGTRSDLELVEGEPEWSTKLVRGYQVIEVAEQGEQSHS